MNQLKKQGIAVMFVSSEMPEVLGIADRVIVMCDGKITALIVPRPSGFLGLSHNKDLVIPWNRIECIGEDAILVKLTPQECAMPENDKKKKKNFW